MELDSLGKEASAGALPGSRGDEADLLGVGLCRSRQPEKSRVSANLGLGELTDGQEHPTELVNRQHRQHI